MNRANRFNLLQGYVLPHIIPSFTTELSLSKRGYSIFIAGRSTCTVLFDVKIYPDENVQTARANENVPWNILPICQIRRY